MQVLKNNKVIMFAPISPNLSLPAGNATTTSQTQRLPTPLRHRFQLRDRPLFILTNTWCSSGSLDPNGTLIQHTKGERTHPL
jgi:hypothetical protein